MWAFWSAEKEFIADWLAPGAATNIEWKTDRSGEETRFVLSHDAGSELVGPLGLQVRVEDTSAPHFTARLGNEVRSREAFALSKGLHGPNTMGIVIFDNFKGDPLKWKNHNELTVVYHGPRAELTHWEMVAESGGKDDLKKSEVRERLKWTGFILFLVSVFALILKHIADFVKAWREGKSLEGSPPATPSSPAAQPPPPQPPSSGLTGLFDDMIGHVRGSNDAETAELQAFLRKALVQNTPVATALGHLPLPNRLVVLHKARHQLMSQLTMTISALEGVRAWAQSRT